MPTIPVTGSNEPWRRQFYAKSESTYHFLVPESASLPLRPQKEALKCSIE
jgi:hypothetical protein